MVVKWYEDGRKSTRGRGCDDGARLKATAVRAQHFPGAINVTSVVCLRASPPHHISHHNSFTRISNMAFEAAGRAAMRSSARTVLSSTNASARAMHPIAASSLTYRRNLSSSSRALAPGQFPPQQGGMQQPYPSYFSRPSRPSLPANTIVRFVPQQTDRKSTRLNSSHWE